MLTVKFNHADTYRDKDGTHLDIVVSSPAQAVEFVAGMSEGKTYAAELKLHRERRSLDANAYAWELMSKLAEALTAEGSAYSKDDIYLIMLKKYGQGGIVKIRNKDKDSILREVKYYEEHEQLYADNAAYYRIWVGSSNYNTKEMSLFLNGIISDCKELGIETDTPEQIARYEEMWSRR